MGIEIGSSNIKMIETVKKGNTQIVKKFSLLPTPKDCINNGVISHIEPVQKVIEEELKYKKYKAKKVVCIIQSSDIIVRNIKMEKYPKKVIRQLLEIKTADFLPIEQEHYQIDFKVLEEVEEGGILKNELLLVAAPNTVVLPVASLMKHLKLTPILISIPSESLENIFSSKTPMIAEVLDNIMVLDIGEKSITVTIIIDGKACLTRILKYGVENLSKESHRDTEYFENSIKLQIEYHIVAEIERILQFYDSSYGDRMIKKIYLTGGGADIKCMRGYIRDALNIPTEKLSHLDTVIESPDIEFESHTRFFVNLLGAINGL